MSDYLGLVLVVVLLAANAFFVGAEFALVSARRTQIEPRAEAGSRIARSTLRAMEEVSQVMAGAQLGITVCSLGLGAVGEPALAHLLEPAFHAAHLPDGLLHPASFVIALLIVTYLHVVLGEMVPKNLALAGADRAALFFGPPMRLTVAVIKPVVVVLNWLANLCVRLVGMEPKDEVASSFTRDEVRAMVDESRGEGLMQEGEFDRMSGALEFADRTVREVLLAAGDLATVERGARVDEVEALCATTGYSRFPVRNGDGDLVGYLHVKDVLEVDETRAHRPIADKWVRRLATVQIDDLLKDALATMRARSAHIARVVDRQGTELGVVMLEDVLEELVGEIRDAAHD